MWINVELISSETDRIIRDLEQRLQEEEIAKNNFLRDLERFKQIFYEMEEENNKLKEKLNENGTRQWKSYTYTNTREEERKRPSVNMEERFTEYESLIGEIKRLTSWEEQSSDCFWGFFSL